MPKVTIKISEEDAMFLIKKTKQKGYFEKAGKIFASAEITEFLALEGEKITI